MARSVPLYTDHGTTADKHFLDLSRPKWKSIFEEPLKNIIFSSPPSGDVTTWPPLLSGRQIMKSRSANYFLIKGWSMSLHLLLHLPSLPNKVTGHSVIGSKILTRPKTTTIWTFLKPVCEQRAKNKRVTVNDFYLALTTKVIFFFPLLSEGIVFVICAAGDELTKVRLCLVLFHLSQPERVQAWRFESICIEQQPRIF